LTGKALIMATFDFIKVLTVAVIAFFAAATSATPDMRVTGTYGDWRGSEGTDNTGEPMCSAGLVGADRALFVKAYHDVFFVDIFKEGWQIPSDQRIEVVLQVESAPPMNFEGGLSPSTASLQFEIDPNGILKNTGQKTITELVNLLKNGRSLRLVFPDGDEPQWQGSLTGSGKALTAMMDCTRHLMAAARPTQPFGAKKAAHALALGPAVAAQPFGQVPPALPQALQIESSEGDSKRQSPSPTTGPHSGDKTPDGAIKERSEARAAKYIKTATGYVTPKHEFSTSPCVDCTFLDYKRCDEQADKLGLINRNIGFGPGQRLPLRLDRAEEPLEAECERGRNTTTSYYLPYGKGQIVCPVPGAVAVEAPQKPQRVVEAWLPDELPGGDAAVGMFFAGNCPGYLTPAARSRGCARAKRGARTTKFKPKLGMRPKRTGPAQLGNCSSGALRPSRE
jgi:hypothetical protein